MTPRVWAGVCALVALTGLSVAAWAEGAAPPAAANRPNDPAPVAAAREQAKLLHEVYLATLDTMHRRYFRREGAVLPARALEDVFAEMRRQTGVKARWIAVNTRAMSISHEPQSDFEKKAAEAIAAGKEAFELVEDGYYHRAGAIPLGSGCVACHTGLLAATPQTRRFAGLVLSVPVKKE